MENLDLNKHFEKQSELLNELQIRIETFCKNKQTEFDRKVSFVRGFFEKEGLPIPEKWESDFLYWYIEHKIGEEKAWVTSIDEIEFSRDNLMEWAIFEKERLLKKMSGGQSSLKQSLTILDKIQNEKSKITEAPQTEIQTKPFIIDPIIRSRLHEGLKQYFEGKDAELENVLNSKQNSEKLVWPLNQNQLAELFLRLSYNGYIKNNKTEIKSWLKENFTLMSGSLNEVTVYETLKRKSDIKKNMRILEDLAPWKPNSK